MLAPDFLLCFSMCSNLLHLFFHPSMLLSVDRMAQCIRKWERAREKEEKMEKETDRWIAEREDRERAANFVKVHFNTYEFYVFCVNVCVYACKPDPMRRLLQLSLWQCHYMREERKLNKLNTTHNNISVLCPTLNSH